MARILPNIPSHFFDSPIYKKALEIRSLSVGISYYLRDDLSMLSKDGRENGDIYFSGDIIQQSSALAPEILNAEMHRNHFDKKYYHIDSLNQLTNLLYKNCKRLERSNRNGRDYLKLLRRELNSFNRLQKKWMLTL